VLEQGVSAAALEYNLANAHLKNGDTGLAILHYRRALKLDPTYESAAENIRYARSLTQDVKPQEETTPERWSWLARLRLGPQLASAWVFFMFLAFATAAALRLYVRRRGLVWVSILLGVFGAATLLLGAALLFEWNELEGTREAVVVRSEVVVHSGPSETYTVSFRLHEGTEVELIRRSSGWREIKVSDRLQGWVPDDAVEPI
jgi:hypothetical protein